MHPSAGKTGPYMGSRIHANSTHYFYIEGPGCTGYYGHLYVQHKDTCKTPEEAQRLAELMNVAFAEGQAQRSREILALLNNGKAP